MAKDRTPETEIQSGQTLIDATPIEPPAPTKLTSSSVLRIAPALSKAQAAVLEVKRNLTGFMPTRDGGYEYKYAGLDEVQNATRAAQKDNGLSLFTPFELDDNGILNLRVFLLHESTEWLNYGLYPLGRFTTNQNLGSSVTYARRYLEGVIYKVSPQDDDDARGPTDEQKARQEKKREAQRAPRDGAPQQRTQQRKPPAKKQGTFGDSVPEFKLPPDWPRSSQEQILSWISGLKPAAHFQAALGMFLNEPEVYSDVKRWFEICTLLNHTYHGRLQCASDERKASLDSITRALDEAMVAVDLDMQSQTAFDRKAPAEEPAK